MKCMVLDKALAQKLGYETGSRTERNDHVFCYTAKIGCCLSSACVPQMHYVTISIACLGIQRMLNLITHLGI